MKEAKMSGLARTIAGICTVMLLAVLFLPIWRIELTAPQYPEGLVLKIWAGKIGGDVEIVNGLNHYIGMKTLHANDFIEFTLLPYIIGGLALLCLLTVLINRRKIFYALTVVFLVVAVASMVDFYKWEYDYGHNLNPDAPIKVPGMAYQPPLIGFRQLLNFGAYSIPDAGGWLFIGVGLLLVAGTVLEWRKAKRLHFAVTTSAAKTAVALLMIAGTISCQGGPAPLKLGKDNCDFCRMTVADARFGAELLTKKGKIYKFDDMHCLLSFMKENAAAAGDQPAVYLVDFTGSHAFVKADKAFLLKAEALRSPMGGNIAAFAVEDSLNSTRSGTNGTVVQWAELLH